MEPIEELFVKISDFHTIPEIRITLVPLMYAKSLFQIKQYVFAFELLQNEFCKRPIYTVFLYFLAKFAILCGEKNFKGTAIGILQECLRSCISQRKAKILYYLGVAYKEMNQPLLAFDYFEKSLEYYKNKDYMFADCPADLKNIMSSHIKEFYDLSQLRHIISTKAAECKRQRKKNNNYQVPIGEVENLKAACKACVRADRYNGSLLRGILSSDIQYDEAETIRVYESMIHRVPQNIKAYIAYYKFLKKENLINKIDSITVKMMTAIEDPSVPTDDWMEAHVIRADALVQLGENDEAIHTLEKLIHIIPPLPIPGLSYLAKLERKQMKDDIEPENENGDINFTYDNQFTHEEQNSFLRAQSMKIMPINKTDVIPEDDEDEEETGAIKIRVTPSEDIDDVKRPHNLGNTEGYKYKSGRNARPFQSSLFLSTQMLGNVSINLSKIYSNLLEIQYLVRI
jgi:tetratricopeptide (TPR) repeat protein